MSTLFNIINIPFSYVIRFFYQLTGNYMLALFFFAIVVKVVLFPVGIKTQKNMVKQASLRPKEMAIRNKYAGRTDQATQQKMQQEVMNLYQEENYSPMAGCLPMILQLIVIWAIYQIVYGPLTYLCAMSSDAVSALKTVVPQLISGNETLLEQFSTFVKVSSEGVASFTGNEISLLRMMKELDPSAITSAISASSEYTAEVLSQVESVLSNMPNMTFLGQDLSDMPTVALNPLLLVPILNLVATWATTKITRKLSYQAPSAEDQQNNMSMKVMEYGMPLMIFYMAFRLPAALGVYWIFQNVLGIAQQFILYKIYPYPTFTDEEIKAASKAAVSTERKEKKSAEQKKIRSLHHIDDEDDAPAESASSAPTRYDRDEETTVMTEKEDAPDKNQGISKAPLKEDDRNAK